MAIYTETYSPAATAIHTVTPGGTSYSLIVEESSPCVLLSPAWSPTSSKIAYIKRCYSDSRGSSQGLFELYSVSTNDIQPTKISGDVSFLEGQGGAMQYSWSPDGSKLGYAGALDRYGVLDLYIVSDDGTGHMKISGNWSCAESVFPNFKWTSDGAKIVYTYGDGIHYSLNSSGLRVSNTDGSLIDEVVANFDRQYGEIKFSVHSLTYE